MSLPKYPNQGILSNRLGIALPNTWSESRLSRLITCGMGQTILKEMVSEESSPGWLPVYSASEGEDVFGYIENPLVRLDSGDLVIGARGSIGKTRQIDKPSTCTQTTIWAKTSNAKLDSRYLYWVFTGLRERLFPFDKTAIPMLTIEQVRSGFIPVPPAIDQAAINNFLDREAAKIDALIAEQQRLIELLQEKRQAVISHAVTKGLNPNAPMKDSGVEWLGEVPGHWEVKNIGLVTERITYGFTNPMPTEEEGPYMLTANDIENGRIRFETCRRTSESAFMEELTDKSRPVNGDILLTKDGTLGRVALYIEKDNAACINQSIALLRPNTTDCLGAFLATALSSDCYQEKMLFDAGGTTIKHIYISRLAKMPVAIPPPVEQEEILQHLEARTRPYELLIADSVASLRLLRERRSALISAAVTGQIDVRGLATEEEP